MLPLLSPPKSAATLGFFYSPIHDAKVDPDLIERRLNLWHPSNISIPLSYWLVGFLGSFIGTPLSVYLVQTLDAQPSQQNTISVLVTIPWSFKLVYGFISDVFPIGGLRRKPYLALGYSLHIACYLFLAWLGTPQFSILSVSIFIATFGQIMGDVMADTLVVERSKLEYIEDRGKIQAACYSIRFSGTVLGYLMGTLLYNQESWGWGMNFRQVCLLNGILPLIFLGSTLWSLYEAPARSRLVSEQCQDIWNTICLKAVWKPMAFVYMFNFFQVPNIAWASYLQLSLLFEPYKLGIISTTGALMSLLGILAYKTFFFRMSWRIIYIYSVCICTVFSLLQLCLIFQWNVKYFHMSNLLFALGDDVVTEYVQGIQFLPICIMYLRLCPDGSEGATYAMLTTFGNVALMSSFNLGTLLSTIWDVSNDTLRNNVYDGLWKLTILTSALAPIPLLFLNLIPANQMEQENLFRNKFRSSIGGSVFLIVLGSSLLWGIIEAFTVVFLGQ